MFGDMCPMHCSSLNTLGSKSAMSKAKGRSTASEPLAEVQTKSF